MKKNFTNQMLLLFILLVIFFAAAEKSAAQSYFTLEQLKGIDLNTYNDVVGFVHDKGYYNENANGDYIDKYGDTMGIYTDDDKRSVIFYDVAATPEAVNFFSNELNSRDNCYLPNTDLQNNSNLYYYSVYGRFSIHVIKKRTFWEFYLRAQKKGDYTPAYENAAGQVEINSYTTSTSIHIIKGDKVYLKAGGRITLGTFAGDCTPDGVDGFSSYSCNTAFPHGSLLGKIGDDGNWFLIGAYKAFTADASGVLNVMVNDCDPANNSGRFYLEYGINKEINP